VTCLLLCSGLWCPLRLMPRVKADQRMTWGLKRPEGEALLKAGSPTLCGWDTAWLNLCDCLKWLIWNQCLYQWYCDAVMEADMWCSMGGCDPDEADDYCSANLHCVLLWPCSAHFSVTPSSEEENCSDREKQRLKCSEMSCEASGLWAVWRLMQWRRSEEAVRAWHACSWRVITV